MVLIIHDSPISAILLFKISEPTCQSLILSISFTSPLSLSLHIHLSITERRRGRRGLRRVGGEPMKKVARARGAEDGRAGGLSSSEAVEGRGWWRRARESARASKGAKESDESTTMPNLLGVAAAGGGGSEGRRRRRAQLDAEDGDTRQILSLSTPLSLLPPRQSVRMASDEGRRGTAAGPRSLSSWASGRGGSSSASGFARLLRGRFVISLPPSSFIFQI